MLSQSPAVLRACHAAPTDGPSRTPWFQARCMAHSSFSHLCCAASEAYGEVRRTSRMRVLSGLSPDESTLILIFASPWTGECTEQ